MSGVGRSFERLVGEGHKLQKSSKESGIFHSNSNISFFLLKGKVKGEEMLPTLQHTTGLSAQKS